MESLRFNTVPLHLTPIPQAFHHDDPEDQDAQPNRANRNQSHLNPSTAFQESDSPAAREDSSQGHPPCDPAVTDPLPPLALPAPECEEYANISKFMDLTDLLHKTFGFPAFRTNQEAVCRAATEGRDVLLVMPTGAGKSLCYQLPAIARGGTALVISPLIALMDDQAAELTAKLLNSPANRPAIVYAPSRKAAEELASTLGGSAAAYHAGLEPSVRERVQRHFLSGKLEVVVATIAFGMGIDKADVRTV